MNSEVRVESSALVARNSRLVAHSSKPTATAGLPPYLVLLRVGFALPAALLSQRCALTAPFHPYPDVVLSPATWHGPTTTAGRYVFCGTFRRMSGSHPSQKRRRMGHPSPSRTLSGTLLCGVRTFLSPRPKAQEAAVRSGCLQRYYMRWGVRSYVSGARLLRQPQSHRDRVQFLTLRGNLAC